MGPSCHLRVQVPGIAKPEPPHLSPSLWCGLLLLPAVSPFLSPSGPGVWYRKARTPPSPPGTFESRCLVSLSQNPPISSPPCGVECYSFPPCLPSCHLRVQVSGIAKPVPPLPSWHLRVQMS